VTSSPLKKETKMFIITLAKMAGYVLTAGGCAIVLCKVDDVVRPPKKDKENDT
jgi:hypothetical protein